MKNIEIVPSRNRIDISHIKGSGRLFMHIHNNYEIYMSMSDNNTFFVGQKIYNVNSFDLFLFNSNDVHKINTNNLNDYERYVAMFPPKLFTENDFITSNILDCFENNSPDRNHKITIPSDRRQEVLDIWQKMFEAKSQGGSMATLKMKLYIAQLLIVICEIKEQMGDIAHHDDSHSNDARLKPIMEYIQKNCEYPITLESISKEVYLNKFYICRLFKEKLGFGINDYIKACRLNNSVALLREGLPVSTVALKTGFGSTSYFIHQFKETFGMSPKKYMRGE